MRRSIDRLWADQFIETSDDWVIPYIGDLLDTNLINGLDARGRRLDVAKTIHYRRRKGTVAVLEEIARDVTGWETHIIEAFRRLSRTRHNLDPPVGPGPLAAALPTPCLRTPPPAGAPQPRDLLEHEGLIGPLTSTPAGGFADLRSLHGGDCTDGPFDEYFHTADLRRGSGAVGRYGIPKLLVFVWRLQSFAVVGGTPVPVSGCTDEYVFDPTGRFVPLFLLPLQPERRRRGRPVDLDPRVGRPGPVHEVAPVRDRRSGDGRPETCAVSGHRAHPGLRLGGVGYARGAGDDRGLSGGGAVQGPLDGRARPECLVPVRLSRGDRRRAVRPHAARRSARRRRTEGVVSGGDGARHCVGRRVRRGHGDDRRLAHVRGGRRRGLDRYADRLPARARGRRRPARRAAARRRDRRPAGRLDVHGRRGGLRADARRVADQRR